jgi:hypothetical protein
MRKTNLGAGESTKLAQRSIPSGRNGPHFHGEGFRLRQGLRRDKSARRRIKRGPGWADFGRIGARGQCWSKYCWGFRISGPVSAFEPRETRTKLRLDFSTSIVGGSWQLPNDFHRISREGRVTSDDRHPIDECLHNQLPVEWIAMMKRQSRQLV